MGARIESFVNEGLGLSSHLVDLGDANVELGQLPAAELPAGPVATARHPTSAP